MARELYEAADGTLRPAAWIADTSQQRFFTSSDDPSSMAGVTMAVGDKWFKAQVLSGVWTPGAIQPSLANQGTSLANCGAKIPRSSMSIVNTNPFVPPNGANITNTVFTNRVRPASNTGGKFSNCYFAGAAPTTGNSGSVDCNQGDGSSGLRWEFDDCTFIPDNPNGFTDNIIGHHYTLTRCILQQGVDGCGSYNNSGPRADNIIQGCWIGFMSWYYPDPVPSSQGGHTNGTHSDVIQHQGDAGLTVVGNTLFGYITDQTNNAPAHNPSGSNNGPYPYDQTGQVIMVQNNTGAWSEVVITDNWIYGGAHGISVRDLGTNPTIKRNLWMDNGQYMDGSRQNYIRTDSGQAINGVTYTTGSWTMTGTDASKWGFTGTNAFGVAHNAGDLITGGVRVP